jgi:hypothetical protein
MLHYMYLKPKVVLAQFSFQVTLDPEAPVYRRYTFCSLTFLGREHLVAQISILPLNVTLGKITLQFCLHFLHFLDPPFSPFQYIPTVVYWLFPAFTNSLP